LNTDEELLTRVLDRATGWITAETLRPLAEPAAAPSRRTRISRAIWNARLAPAAAAVAVILVVATALVVTGGTHQGKPAGQTAGGTSVPGLAGAPEYYAEVEGDELHGPHGPGPVAVVVRSTATGAVVARIPTPSIVAAPKAIPFSVAVAPDDRTFYALYANWGKKPGGDFWIYRFRITSSGRATRPAAVSGGLITGQDYLGNVGGFAVSPDGSRLALAVASGHASSVESGLATEILVIDLRTGAHATWRGGMDRPGQVFGIQSLSWTRGGGALAYQGQWCQPADVVYGLDGYVCVKLSSRVPSRYDGTDVVREISVTPGGGRLDSGPVLRSPAKAPEPEPVLADPSGKYLITMVSGATSGLQNVVKVSIATGDVTSVLGAVPRIPHLFGNYYLAADRTGRYVLAWMTGTAGGRQLHGWVQGGAYHQLAPALPPGGATIQMTW
jgi:hypothetical protein